MAKRYYLDTSIWLDYYENRGRRGQAALKLFKKIMKENSLIVFSDLHILELKHVGYAIEEITKLFSIFKSNLTRAHTYSKQKELARKIATKRNIPKGDVLHAILARDNETILITRDAHFERLREIIIPRKPEEII